MGDILNGIYDVPRDARGRRLATNTIVPATIDIAQPIEITVDLLDAISPTIENDTALVGTFSAETVGTGTAGSYDPADHTVAEVLAYATDHPDEIPAIVAAETAGKARKMILGLV